MKKFIESQKIFDLSLKILFVLSKFKITENVIPVFAKLLAKLNLKLNKPRQADDLKKLAETWKELMPHDGQTNFKIADITENTAYVEIHLNCPLRGTGKVNSCYSFMNYDRTLMENVGASLTVLESQSNSGNSYCKLAIRRIEEKTDDLSPAHLKKN